MMAAPLPVMARRAPRDVMRLARLGSFHQSRLSFMRVLLRRLASESWQVTRRAFEIDSAGVGHALYVAKGPERSYTLVAFAHDLPDALRSDRVIAEAWDATFALFDGIPSPKQIAQLAQNVPRQEAGRVDAEVLSLSRANRSVRLWSHVVEALSQGRQPDAQALAQVGYLMRTTAVYGSGKFGAADRAKSAARPETLAPFQVEMLSVYLTRLFVRDLVEHMAQAQGGARAVRLAPDLARSLGIGNSTGLGMAPFLLAHPILFNNWIMAREEAIARVRAVEEATPEAVSLFLELLARQEEMVSGWRSSHPLQLAKCAALRADLTALGVYLRADGLAGWRPWDRLIAWSADALSLEGQELLASLILEPYGDLVDGLSSCMADLDGDDAQMIDAQMPVSEARALIERTYDFALETDWQAPEAQARVWYVSEEKLEPRLGERASEPVALYEQPLAPARDMVAAYHALGSWRGADRLAPFLAAHPEHRHSLRRLQILRRAPYGEIRDNTIDAHMLPIDMLRAKLSFFGATDFDPRSDRWVRICMYAGAPYPEELTVETAAFWVYPERGGADGLCAK